MIVGVKEGKACERTRRSRTSNRSREVKRGRMTALTTTMMMTLLMTIRKVTTMRMMPAMGKVMRRPQRKGSGQR